MFGLIRLILSLLVWVLRNQLSNWFTQLGYLILPFVFMGIFSYMVIILSKPLEFKPKLQNLNN